MPIFRSALTPRSFVDAQPHQPADALLVEPYEGVDLDDARLDVGRQGSAPNRRARCRRWVWVRSLVPNEKKSACCAISSAMMQARDNSIIVPTPYSDLRHGLGENGFGGRDRQIAHALERCRPVRSAQILAL